MRRLAVVFDPDTSRPPRALCHAERTRIGEITFVSDSVRVTVRVEERPGAYSADLPPGTYRVTAKVDGETCSSMGNAVTAGAKEVVQRQMFCLQPRPNERPR